MCGGVFEEDDPVITNDFGGQHHYAPFFQDLRSNPQELRHPLCFADEFGVAALIDAIQREDLRRDRPGFKRTP